MDFNRINRPWNGAEPRSLLCTMAFLAALAANLGAAPAPSSNAQAATAKAASGDTVPALLVSDIHFDPFMDPAKVPLLAESGPGEWKKVLAAPPSMDRDARYAAMQQACSTRGEDTSYALFDSSLQAIRKDAAGAGFATLSGDLLAHSFDCKYRAVFPHAAPGDYRAFVEKTLAFVVGELRAALPDTPIYVALGNNDSDCGDYQLDAHSEFLASVGRELTKGFPASERKAAEQTFASGGYYSVRLPAPIRNARLLVLDDLFMSAKYSTCGGKPNPAAAGAQIAWLEQQLAEARAAHEKIWVMAHIPPGVDVYSSAKHLDEVCGAKGPRMFLSSEKLAEVLAQFADVVQLAIFAHTHMDEIRLLKPDDAAHAASSAPGVAVKMASSVSPINGNAPSFTVARVNPATASLEDFKVFAASNTSGVGAAWNEEYDWGNSYRQDEFSAASVAGEIAGFAADKAQETDKSRDYIREFYVGRSPLLGLIWPQYVCSLQNDSAQGFKACVCPAGK
jgi:sphingomyelin phosphodiesterase acid-like 3